jgi:hypothetical protein
MTWHVQTEDVRDDFFSKRLIMTSEDESAPDAHIAYNELRNSPEVETALQEVLSHGQSFKANVSATFTVLDHRTEEEHTWHVKAGISDVNDAGNHPRDIEAPSWVSLLLQVVDRIFTRMKYLQSLQGYELSIESLKEIQIHTADTERSLIQRFDQRFGGQYVPLPKSLQNKHCCINVQSGTDNRCFALSIMSSWLCRLGVAHLEEQGRYFQRGAGRPAKGSIPELIENPYCWDDLSWPVSVKQLEVFESNNPSTKLYVYEWDENDFPHLRRAASGPAPEEICLLLYQKHWCWIKNFNAFMMRTTSSYHSNDRYFCHRCTSGFSEKAKYEKHMSRWCLTEEVVENTVPPPGTFACWDPHKKAYMVHMLPAVVYADFETKTVEGGLQVPVSYAWVLCPRGGWQPGLEHRINIVKDDEDIVQIFLKDMFRLLYEFTHVRDEPLREPKDMKRRWARDKQMGCYVCGSMTDLCKDHNHLSSKANYRGAACRVCNSNMKRSRTLVVGFHNGSKFDFQFLLTAFAKMKANGPDWLKAYEWSILPKSRNQYLSMSLGHEGIGKILFIDTFRHQQSSLASLIEAQLKFGTPEEVFPLTVKHHPWRRKLDLILRKIPFAYGALNADTREWAKMPALQPREAYNNSLARTTCSEKQYAETGDIYKALGLQTFLQVHNCYLWGDVTMLADVCERYRTEWWQRFGLDPFHNLTLPSASYQAMLRQVGPKFELPSSMDFVQRVNDNIMGGLSMAAKPHFKKTPGHCMRPIDACSLYPSQMRHKLPVGDYRKLDGDLMAQAHQILENWTMESDTGYMIVCDFHVPSDRHAEVDLPPCCRMKITKAMLSPEQRKDHHEGVKLVPFLGEHKESGRHVALLQCWQKFCHIEITAVHEIWAFRQEDCLSEFIEELAKVRREGTSEVAKTIVKLVMSSIYGKLLERLDNRCQAKLCTNPEKFFKSVAKRSTKDFAILDNDNFLGLYVSGPKGACFDTPRAAAWCILDYSKVQYWSWYYGCIKKLWPDAVLYGMDTDSGYISLPCEIEEFKQTAEEWNRTSRVHPFDLSLFRNNEFKGQLGAWKDEAGPAEIEEAVFLQAKLYAVKMPEEDKLRAKGVPKAILNEYRFQTFKQLLVDPTPVYQTFHALRVVKNQSIKKEETKKCLSFVNDKIWMQKVGEEWVCRPLGHKDNF